MGTHGSESFFVLGEGLLGETAGGREPTLALAPDVAAITPPFRFSRLGPKGTGKQLNEANRKKIGSLMAGGTGGAGQIPAGFTYLGQFVDHDLTFDRTAVMLGDTSPSCSGTRRPFAARPGALPQPRPGLAVRGRAGRSRIGEVL